MRFKKLLLSLVAMLIAIPTMLAQDVPQSIWVVGSGEGLTWTLPGKEYKGNNGVFTFTVNNLDAFKASTAQATGEDWNTFNASAWSTANATFGDAVGTGSGQTLPIQIWGEDQNVPWTGNYTITIDFVNNTMTAYTSTPKPTTAPDAYIVGAMTNTWSIVSTYKFTYDSSTASYTWTGSLPANSEFKIAGANGTEVSWNGAINYSSQSAITVNGVTNVSMNYNQQNNMTMSAPFEGTITFRVTSERNTAMATFVPSGNVTYPESMYVIGSLPGGSWNPEYGIKMQSNGEGVYTATNVEIDNNTDSSTGGFALVEELNSNWTTLNNKRYGPAETNTPAIIGAPGTPVDGSGDRSWTIPAGTYNMTFNYPTMTLMIEEVEETVPAVTYIDGAVITPADGTSPQNVGQIKIEWENGIALDHTGYNESSPGVYNKSFDNLSDLVQIYVNGELNNVWYNFMGSSLKAATVKGTNNQSGSVGTEDPTGGDGEFYVVTLTLDTNAAILGMLGNINIKIAEGIIKTTDGAINPAFDLHYTVFNSTELPAIWEPAKPDLGVVEFPDGEDVIINVSWEEGNVEELLTPEITPFYEQIVDGVNSGRVNLTSENLAVVDGKLQITFTGLPVGEYNIVLTPGTVRVGEGFVNGDSMYDFTVTPPDATYFLCGDIFNGAGYTQLEMDQNGTILTAENVTVNPAAFTIQKRVGETVVTTYKAATDENAANQIIDIGEENPYQGTDVDGYDWILSAVNTYAGAVVNFTFDLNTLQLVITKVDQPEPEEPIDFEAYTTLPAPGSEVDEVDSFVFIWDNPDYVVQVLNTDSMVDEYGQEGAYIYVSCNGVYTVENGGITVTPEGNRLTITLTNPIRDTGGYGITAMAMLKPGSIAINGQQFKGLDPETETGELMASVWLNPGGAILPDPTTNPQRGSTVGSLSSVNVKWEGWWIDADCFTNATNNIKLMISDSPNGAPYYPGTSDQWQEVPIKSIEGVDPKGTGTSYYRSINIVLDQTYTDGGKQYDIYIPANTIMLMEDAEYPDDATVSDYWVFKYNVESVYTYPGKDQYANILSSNFKGLEVYGDVTLLDASLVTLYKTYETPKEENKIGTGSVAALTMAAAEEPTYIVTFPDAGTLYDGPYTIQISTGAFQGLGQQNIQFQISGNPVPVGNLEVNALPENRSTVSSIENVKIYWGDYVQLTAIQNPITGTLSIDGQEQQIEYTIVAQQAQDGSDDGGGIDGQYEYFLQYEPASPLKTSGSYIFKVPAESVQVYITADNQPGNEEVTISYTVVNDEELPELPEPEVSANVAGFWFDAFDVIWWKSENVPYDPVKIVNKDLITVTCNGQPVEILGVDVHEWQEDENTPNYENAQLVISLDEPQFNLDATYEVNIPAGAVTVSVDGQDVPCGEINYSVVPRDFADEPTPDEVPEPTVDPASGSNVDELNTVTLTWPGVDVFYRSDGMGGYLYPITMTINGGEPQPVTVSYAGGSNINADEYRETLVLNVNATVGGEYKITIPAEALWFMNDELTILNEPNELIELTYTVNIEEEEPGMPEGTLEFEDFEMEFDPKESDPVTVTVPVSLNVDAPFTYQGFQFDITLPTGLSVTAVALNSLITKDDETGSITVVPYTKDVPANTYRVLANFDETQLIEDIATLTVSGVYSTDLPIGEQPVVIQNTVVFSTELGQDIYTIEGYEGIVDIQIAEIPAEEITIDSVTLMEPSYSMEENDMVDTVTQGESVEITVTVTPADTTDELEWSADVDGVEFNYDPETGKCVVNTDGVDVAEGEEVEITITIKANDDVEVEYTLTVKGVLLGDSNDNGKVSVADVVTTANYIAQKPVADFCFPNANVILNEVNNEQVINVQDLTATVNIVLNLFDGNRTPQNVKRHVGNYVTTDRLVSDNFKAVKGSPFVIGVNLDNANSYSALQTTVVVPAGMKVLEVTAGPRAAEHEVVFNRTADGNVQVVVYSLNNASFAECAGSLFNLTVTADSNCDALRMDNITASDASSNGYELSHDGGLNASATGVDGINGGELAVVGGSDGLTIYNAEGLDIRVYTVGGELVAARTADSSTVRIDVVKGIYVVVVNGEAVKAYVK